MSAANATVRSRFAAIVQEHGLSFTKALFTAYTAWCAANPSSRICASPKSMHMFAAMMESGRAHPPSTTLGDSTTVAAASYGMPSNFRVKHKLRCEGDDLIITASDLVGVVTSPAATTIGTVLQNFTFHPQALQGSRLASLSNLFEKWKLRKLQFHWQPSVSTATAGQIVLAWDNDPADSAPPADESGVRTLYSYRSNAATSVWAPTTLLCVLDSSTESYFTSLGTDPRLYAAGSLYLVSGGGVPSSTQLGTLWISYEVALSSPSENASGPSDNYWVKVVTPGAGLGASGTSIVAIAGTVYQNTSAISYATTAGGYPGLLFVPGTYLAEVIFTGVGLACNFTLYAGTNTGSAVETVVSDVDTNAVAGNAGARKRVWVRVPNDTIGYVFWLNSVNTTVGLGTIRAVTCELAVTGPAPTPAAVSAYAF